MKKWKLLNKKPIFKSKWLALEHRIYKLPDKRVENYYHLHRPDYVLILAIDFQKRIVIGKQYRRGVGEFVYEIPAGWVKDHEDPLKTATRELKEETGFTGKGKIIGQIFAQPGFCSMNAYIVLLDIDPGEKAKSQSKKDEQIEFQLIPLNEVLDMIKDGKIKDMGTISAILIYILKNT